MVPQTHVHINACLCKYVFVLELYTNDATGRIFKKFLPKTQFPLTMMRILLKVLHLLQKSYKTKHNSSLPHSVRMEREGEEKHRPCDSP